MIQDVEFLAAEAEGPEREGKGRGSAGQQPKVRAPRCVVGCLTAGSPDELVVEVLGVEVAACEVGLEHLVQELQSHRAQQGGLLLADDAAAS